MDFTGSEEWQAAWMAQWRREAAERAQCEGARDCAWSRAEAGTTGLTLWIVTSLGEAWKPRVSLFLAAASRGRRLGGAHPSGVPGPGQPWGVDGGDAQ